MKLLFTKQQEEARRRHRALQSTIVETALRYWRSSMPKPGSGGDAEKFWEACAALEKFETEEPR